MSHLRCATEHLRVEVERLHYLMERANFEGRPARANAFAAQRSTVQNCIVLLSSIAPPPALSHTESLSEDACDERRESVGNSPVGA